MGHFYGYLVYAHLWIATQGFEIQNRSVFVADHATTSHMGSVLS